ncbi:hypothetical protein WJX73_008974 [Symbiochloris irregularis]|uniref:N-acetyltransferase domain-containing protein n=1 Tax=Symbiochloris irregularis TaxID=706552 RepID=A0AAW1NXK3_9CHLO
MSAFSCDWKQLQRVHLCFPRPGRAAIRWSPTPSGQRRQAGSSTGSCGRRVAFKLCSTADGCQLALVNNLRLASTYIRGHQHTTIVVVVPWEVTNQESSLESISRDLMLLQGQGVRLVVAAGSPAPASSLQNNLADRAKMSETLLNAQAAMLALQAKLSQGPDIKMVRRHTRTFANVHSKPAIHTVSGNWVSAKATGILEGKHQGCQGQVRFVDADAMDYQLAAGNVVMLSSLGFGNAGQPLHCDIYSVATAAAAALKADKLVCLTMPGMLPFQLPSSLTVREAQSLLNTLAAEKASQQGGNSASVQSGTDAQVRRWQKYGLPGPLVAACSACISGVRRSHLVDASMDGALLLEMYSDTGAGTMVLPDFHEGMRAAADSDLEALRALMRPLEQEGILVPRSLAQLQADLPHFYVVDSRDGDGQVMGCAMLKPLEGEADGHLIGELGAFCTQTAHRGSGIGDSLLEWLEMEALAKGLTRLVLLSTRTGAWFQDRGYRCEGLAHASQLLPASRRSKVNAARNSLLYVKDLEVEDPTAEAGVLATSRGPTAGIGAPVLANISLGLSTRNDTQIRVNA